MFGRLHLKNELMVGRKCSFVVRWTVDVFTHNGFVDWF